MEEKGISCTIQKFQDDYGFKTLDELLELPEDSILENVLDYSESMSECSCIGDAEYYLDMINDYFILWKWIQKAKDEKK